MRAVALVAGLLLLGAPAAAQRGMAFLNNRSGLWFGVGLALGGATSKCIGCPDRRDLGASGYLRAGATLSPSVLLGVEGHGWAYSGDFGDERIGFASFTASWYPSSTGAFYVKVGIGGMDFRADGVTIIRARAPAGLIGLGYEFRMGHNTSVAAFGNAIVSSAAEFERNGQPAPSEDIRITLLQVGLGFTWH